MEPFQKLVESIDENLEAILNTLVHGLSNAIVEGLNTRIRLLTRRAFGFHSFSATIYRELTGWLLPIALATDVGTVPVGALIDEMRERKVLAPALSTIERLAWETRRRAERLVFVRLTAPSRMYSERNWTLCSWCNPARE